MEDSQVERHDSYLRHLPTGRVVEMPPKDAVVGWEIFPFTYEGLTPVHLDEPVFPEPPRAGEDDPRDCGACGRTDGVIWSDDDWQVLGVPTTSLPAILVLEPRGHHDFADLPSPLLAGLGPMLARLEEALMAVPGTGRVHFNKWGDGSAHLHFFAFARPAGMRQLRGSCLFLWDDILPDLPDQVLAEHLAIASAVLVRSGGTDHLAARSG